MSMIKAANPKAIKEAAEILKNGGIVAIPTETVYGLAANAFDDKAVARVFAAKGRPSFNPLISHFPSLKAMERFIEPDERIKALARAFWPGPLTLIAPRKEGSGLSELASAGLGTIALRIPAHPVAQDLLKQLDFPLVAPSANTSGTLSPTSPMHVAESLGDKVDMILAAGQTAIGLESTVLDLSGDAPVILRPGAITAEDISAVLGIEIAYDHEPKDAPKSPGQMLKHYAPNTPLRLNAVDVKPGEALLAFGAIQFMGIEGGGAAKDLPPENLCNLSEDGDLHQAAANLFAMLKALDQSGADVIAVMNIPAQGLGIAINDRLHRAAASSTQE